jgi:hypothetical protein
MGLPQGEITISLLEKRFRKENVLSQERDVPPKPQNGIWFGWGSLQV